MLGHAAAPHFFAGEQAVLRVEKQRGADFDPFATDAQAQKLGGFLRRIHQRQLPHLFAQHPPADFQHRGKLRVGGAPHAFVPA